MVEPLDLSVQLEAGVAECFDNEYAAEMSAAISLKRIADALDHLLPILQHLAHPVVRMDTVAHLSADDLHELKRR